MTHIWRWKNFKVIELYMPMYLTLVSIIPKKNYFVILYTAFINKGTTWVPPCVFVVFTEIQSFIFPGKMVRRKIPLVQSNTLWWVTTYVKMVKIAHNVADTLMIWPDIDDIYIYIDGVPAKEFNYNCSEALPWSICNCHKERAWCIYICSEALAWFNCKCSEALAWRICIL
jgi:hypothetical protein